MAPVYSIFGGKVAWDGRWRFPASRWVCFPAHLLWACSNRLPLCVIIDATFMQVLAQATQLVRVELQRDPNTLFLVGTYSIGKEKVLEAVAKATGSRYDLIAVGSA